MAFSVSWKGLTPQKDSVELTITERPAGQCHECLSDVKQDFHLRGLIGRKVELEKHFGSLNEAVVALDRFRAHHQAVEIGTGSVITPHIFTASRGSVNLCALCDQHIDQHR